MVTIEFKDEEGVIVDLESVKPTVKESKYLQYSLNENKALLKMKSNLERGGVKVMDTPKKGAKIITMNPGEFGEVMKTLVNIGVGQKFTIENVNVHVTENCESIDKLQKKTLHKGLVKTSASW